VMKSTSFEISTGDWPTGDFALSLTFALPERSRGGAVPCPYNSGSFIVARL
jgi:hypothetical protein